MLKITSDHSRTGYCSLKLEGRIVGLWVAELRRQCELELALNSQLSLDLSGVHYLDRQASSLLWELTHKDVAIRDCSIFVLEQLRSHGG